MMEKVRQLKTDIEEKISLAADVQERIRLLNELAWDLRSIDTVSALELSEEAHHLAINFGDEAGTAESILNKGISYCYLADYESSLANLVEARSRFHRLAIKLSEAKSYNWIGNVYWRMGDHAHALEAYTASSDISGEISDETNMASCLTNIGRVYQHMGDYSEALEYHKKSLAIREKTQCADRATSFWDISRAYKEIGDYESALSYCRESLRIRKESGDTRSMGASLHILGEIYEEMGDYRAALKNYLRALDSVSRVGERWGESMTLSRIGSMYTRVKKPEKALPHLQKSREIAQEIKAKEVLYQVHSILAETYVLIGDHVTALEHYRLFHEIKEEVVGKQAEQTLKFYQRGHEIERTQKEAEIYRLKNVELADALEEVKMLNEYLAQVNHDLETLNEEKNDFLGVVAHDLKNPLASMLMEASTVKSYLPRMEPEEVIKHMEKIQQTALRMKEIINNILDLNAIESGKLNIITGKYDIVLLLHSVVKDYWSRAKAKDIIIRSEGMESSVLALVDETAFLQVMDNLVSNAIKFSPFGSEIFVRVRLEEYFAVCEVEDRGPGFTEADKSNLFKKFARLTARPSGGEHSTGLGLSIVKKLVEAMNGGVLCESEYGKGTRFTIRIPLAL